MKTANNRGNPKKFSIKSVYHEFIYILFFAIPLVVFFYRLFYPVGGLFMIPDFGESDVLHLNLPLKYFLSESLKNNAWPLWTEKLMGGFPLTAESQIGTFYLPNLVLFKYLPLLLAYNLNLLLSFFLAGVGMYLFCKKCNFSRPAALYTGLIFSFSGFFSVHLNHFNLLQASSLLPWIFLGFKKLIKNHTLLNLIFTSYLISQQIFAGYFYVTFITILGVLIVFFKRDFKRLLLLILPLFIAIFLSSIQILPTVELTLNSQRNGGLSFETVTAMSYPFKHLLTFLIPYFYGDPALGTYPKFSQNWGIFWENTAYIGILPVLIAIGSLFYISKKNIKIFLVLAFISLLLLLGKQSPVYFLFSLSPFNLFRNTSRYILLFLFSLTLLSGSFVDIVGKKINSRLFLSVFYFILIFSFAIDEFKFSYKYPPLSPSKKWLDTPPIINKINTNKRLIPYATEYSWNEIFLDQGWQNIDSFLEFKNSLFPDQNIFYGLNSLSINTGGLIPRRNNLWKSIFADIDYDQDKKTFHLSPLAIKGLELWGTDTIISTFHLDSEYWHKIDQLKFKSGNSFSLYKNDSVRDFIYFATGSVMANSVEEFMRELSNLKQNVIIFEGDKNLNFSTPGNYTITDSQNFSLHKRFIKTDSPGLLVINQSYYPGWNAYLNGKKSAIYEVNLNQPAIIIPKGSHILELRFENNAFLLGKKLTIISHIIAFLMVFLSFFPFHRKSKAIY